MESNLSDLIPKFVALIEEARGTVQPPASEAELVAFETRWNVTLPADMRKFYATMNGTGEGSESVTDCLFRIWPLAETRPISQMEPDISPADAAIEDAAYYLCFSDYMIGSDVYAIHATEPTSVIGVCSGPRHVATSFTDFIAKLVTNYELLF